MNFDPSVHCKFEDFLDTLPGKSIAVVFSYSDNVDKQRVWYHRWRSDVIMYFGQGAEALGMEVRYLDVDNYLSHITSAEGFSNDFVINLHSGVKDISSWPIISSTASWKHVPVGFCPSDVHITCERKDITRALALDMRFNLPKKWTPAIEDGVEFVIKHRDLGMSSGLTKSSDRQELIIANNSDHWIVEEFVPGFDATVALVSNSQGGYSVIGARIYKPKSPEPLNWMFTEEMKLLPNQNDAYITEKVEVDYELASELILLSRRLGAGSVYRFDFRVVAEEAEVAPLILCLDNSWLLEVTPTPTISDENDFGSMLKDALKIPALLQELAGGGHIYAAKLGSPQAVLVANILYKSAASVLDVSGKTLEK